MSRKTSLIVIVVIVVLAISASVIYAQGNGQRGAGGAGANNGRGGYGRSGAVGTQTGAGMNSGMGAGVGAGGNGQGTMLQLHSDLGLNTLPPATVGELPAAVVDAMTAGIQDEYNAYAVYQAVIDQFGAVAPFTNIQAAEAQHIAAWEFLFERYGLEAPAAQALESVPQFASLADACQTAANAEIANFGLYDSALETLQDYPDMVQVVTALRDASEFNHLPAFENCAG